MNKLESNCQHDEGAIPDKVQKVWRCRKCGEIIAQFLTPEERVQMRLELNRHSNLMSRIVSVEKA